MERTNGPPTAAISAPELGNGADRKIMGRKISASFFLPIIFLPKFRFMGSRHGPKAAHWNHEPGQAGRKKGA